jgi:hypothetical protein
MRTILAVIMPEAFWSGGVKSRCVNERRLRIWAAEAVWDNQRHDITEQEECDIKTQKRMYEGQIGTDRRSRKSEARNPKSETNSNCAKFENSEISTKRLKNRIETQQFFFPFSAHFVLFRGYWCIADL